jgi:putative PIN family toxin of toxin-antitoxin system
MPAVVDANVLLSGYVGEGTPPSRVVDAWRDGRFELVTSEPILAEVSRAFNDRYFLKRLTPEEMASNLAVLRDEARIVPVLARVHGVATHPEDDLVLATAKSGGAAYVVTGDKPRRRLGVFEGIAIVSPREFLDLLEDGLGAVPERRSACVPLRLAGEGEDGAADGGVDAVAGADAAVGAEADGPRGQRREEGESRPDGSPAETRGQLGDRLPLLGVDQLGQVADIARRHDDRVAILRQELRLRGNDDIGVQGRVGRGRLPLPADLGPQRRRSKQDGSADRLKAQHRAEGVEATDAPRSFRSQELPPNLVVCDLRDAQADPAAAQALHPAVDGRMTGWVRQHA